MKRELLCQKCGSAINLRAYAGEAWKKVYGTLNPAHGFAGSFRCDSCNTVLRVGDAVVALSMYQIGGYCPWEADYVKPQAFQSQESEESLPGRK